jgi:hypothetical protein
MICKGWYDVENQNRTTMDALYDYQSYKTGCERKYLYPSDIFAFSLMPTAKAYFNTYEWAELIQERMLKDADFARFNRKTIEVNQDYINELFIREIASLQVKKDNDEWIIDLSEYENVHTDWWINS